MRLGENKNKIFGKFNYYTLDNELARGFLLMPSEVKEILELQENLGYSLERCFEITTGRSSYEVKNISLEITLMTPRAQL